MNIYLSDKKKSKMWRKKGSAHDQEHQTSSVKHSGGSAMAWVCTAASGTSH